MLAAVAASAAAGCTIKNDSTTTSATSSKEYDALYDVPQAAAAQATDIVGLWETTQSSGGVDVEVRMLFRDGRIQLANRCSSDGYETVTVGVTVQATFATGKISVTDKGGTVQQTSKGPAGKPDLICKVTLTGPGDATYALGAGKLQIVGFTLTKVTD